MGKIKFTIFFHFPAVRIGFTVVILKFGNEDFTDPKDPVDPHWFVVVVLRSQVFLTQHLKPSTCRFDVQCAANNHSPKYGVMHEKNLPIVCYFAMLCNVNLRITSLRAYSKRCLRYVAYTV